MTGQLERPRLTVAVGPGDHVRGPAAAPLTLVEYGDFECPYCGAAYPILKEAERILGGRVESGLPELPADRGSSACVPGGRAAEAAAAQGRFWEMHDRLFEHQDRLDARQLLGHARALALDVARVEADLDAHAHEERVRNDFLSGLRSGVNGDADVLRQRRTPQRKL